MWMRSYSKIFRDVDINAVWRVWTDVNNWPKWDSGLEYCDMKGEFAEGTQFILKPKGGPKVKITLSEVVPKEKFTDYCKFLGATMYDFHELRETEEGLLITNKITVTGIFHKLWVKLVARKVADSIPEQIAALVKLAREQQ